MENENEDIVVLLTKDEFEWPPGTEPKIEEPKKEKKQKKDKEKRKKEKEKEEAKQKKKNRKRSATKDDNEEPSTSKIEESVDYAQKPKKKNHRRITCVTCNQDIMPGLSPLPENSLYCSISCIKAMVEQCKQCVKPNEKINFLDEQGTLIQLPDFQTVYLPVLEEFLLRKPSFKPFVDFAKLLPKETSTKAYDIEIMTKKEDTIRANVRKTILDQLMIRSKKSKVGISRKATQEFAEQVESELYKLHKSAKSSKYKEWCSDFFSTLTDDLNMFFKAVVTNVYSAKKLVTLKKDEMVIVSEAPLQKIERPPPKPIPKRQIPAQAPKPSALDTILGDDNADTTDRHNTHEFDSRCKICIDKVRLKQTQMELMMKDREELLEERRRRKELGKRLLTNRVEPSSQSDRNRVEPQESRLEDMSEKSYSPSRNYSPLPSQRRYSPRRYSPRRERSYSPRRCSPPRRLDSPVRYPSKRERSYSPRRNSPSKRPFSTIRESPNGSYTPPPGVSPDRVALRKLSPTRPYSPRFELPDNKMTFDEMKRTLRPESYNFPQNKTPGLLEGPVDVGPIKTPEVFGKLHGMRPPIGSYSGGPMHSPPIQLSPPSHEQYPNPSRRSRPSDRYPEHPFNRSMSVPDLPPVGKSPVVEVVSVWATKNPIVWTGKIEGDGLSLCGSLKAICNPISFNLRGKLPEVISVKARVRPEPMWAFINDIKTSRKYQILIYLIIPSENDDDNYEKTYKELENSKRYAVLDFPKEVGPKETYMFRIEPNENLPKVFESIDGPGLPIVGNETGRLCVVMIKYADVMIKHEPIDQEQPMSQDIPKNPDNVEEILKFIEDAPDAKALFKGVHEYLSTHKVTPEEKQKIQTVCTNKIEKHKKQQQQPNQQPQNEQLPQKETSIKVKENNQNENDFDDRMEIVEPEDEEVERKEKVESPFEAGEITDSPMEVDPSPTISNGNYDFLLPPPPPPPALATFPPPQPLRALPAFPPPLLSFGQRFPRPRSGVWQQTPRGPPNQWSMPMPRFGERMPPQTRRGKRPFVPRGQGGRKFFF